MTSKLVIDPNKQRVTIALGIPMYNELVKGHLHETMDNAIACGFDYIVVLDDGSTDGSWVVLQEYAARYNHISIFRNDQNSVIYQGKNRWKFLVDQMARFKPDWIVIRAADQIYSFKATIAGGDLFRKKLTEFYHKGIEMVSIPCVHLWRSRTWYRADNVWGRDAAIHSKSPIWRFHKDYSFKGRELTGTHRGWHHPTNFGYGEKRKLIKGQINPKNSNKEIVVLHLGHTTHANKVLKFKWSMEAAKANAQNGRSNTMPPPNNMPPLEKWLLFDGYKGFYEFGMKLKQADPQWFAGNILFDAVPPTPESMYYSILEYNPERAEEYLKKFKNSYSIIDKNGLTEVIDKNGLTEGEVK